MRKTFCAMVCFLLLGCDVNVENYLRLPPRSDKDELRAAISRHDFKKVQKLVGEGRVGVNDIIGDRYHSRPLHVAAYYADEAIVVFLLEKGADIDAREIETAAATALHIAIWKGHEKTANKLLDLGADPSIDLNSGISTCLFAKRSGMSSVVARLPSCN